MKPIVAEARGPIPAPIETVFDVLASIDLTSILRGDGPLPAVVAVEDQTADWSSIGESRIIRLADGSAMLETLTDYERPRRFAYRVTESTSRLRFLVRSFRGEWRFVTVDEASALPVVYADWRYEFEPRSVLTRPLAAWLVRRHWQPYMERALELASQQAVAAARAAPAAHREGEEDG